MKSPCCIVFENAASLGEGLIVLVLT